MSDMSDAGSQFLAAAESGEMPAAPAAEEAPPVEEAPAAEPAASEEPADEDRKPVPWGEAKKTRDEAARYRTQLREYEEAFEGWAPEDAKALMQAVKVTGAMVAEGRSADAAAVYQQIAKLLGPEAAEAVQDAAEDAAEGDDGDDELLTRAEVARMLEERDQHRAYEQDVERQMRTIRKQADELGYDPDSEEWAEVLSRALTFHDGDVGAAAEAIKAREQAVIDKWRASKQETARRTPRVASGASPVPSGPEPPKDFDEAGAQLRAFLDSQTA